MPKAFMPCYYSILSTTTLLECTLLVNLPIQYCCQFQLGTVRVLSCGHYFLFYTGSQQNFRLKTRHIRGIMKTEFSKPFILEPTVVLV